MCSKYNSTLKRDWSVYVYMHVHIFVCPHSVLPYKGRTDRSLAEYFWRMWRNLLIWVKQQNTERISILGLNGNLIYSINTIKHFKSRWCGWNIFLLQGKTVHRWRFIVKSERAWFSMWVRFIECIQKWIVPCCIKKQKQTKKLQKSCFCAAVIQLWRKERYRTVICLQGNSGRPPALAGCFKCAIRKHVSVHPTKLQHSA